MFEWPSPLHLRDDLSALRIAICNLLFPDIFKWCCRLVVRDIELWLVPYGCEFGEDLVKSGDVAVVLQKCYWYGENGIGVVVVRYKVVLVAFEAHDGERTSCIGV